MALIDRKRLAELRKLNQRHRENETWMAHSPEKYDEILDTLSALLTVKEAAENIERGAIQERHRAGRFIVEFDWNKLMEALAAVKEDVPGKNI